MHAIKYRCGTPLAINCTSAKAILKIITSFLPIVVEYETHFVLCKQVQKCNIESTFKFLFSNMLPNIFLYHRDNYLFNQTTWSICKEPENIILWNIVLFSILLAIGVIEAILCFIQVISGLTGFICGSCMRKRKVGMQ